MSTVSADPALSAASKGLSELTAIRTNKAIAPANIFKILSARRFIRKPIEKLSPGSRVVMAWNRHFETFWHHYILYGVELNGYPFGDRGCALVRLATVTSKLAIAGGGGGGGGGGAGGGFELLLHAKSSNALDMTRNNPRVFCI